MTEQEKFELMEKARKGDKIAQAKLATATKSGEIQNKSLGDAFNQVGSSASSWIKDAWNWLKGSQVKDEASKLWNGLTGETSANATLEANKMNIENQNYWNQIAMQREDTAHQREVADLQAAGLNPWLSTGGGAQTASLSTAQAEPVDGSKILQATSAAALFAIIKLLAKKG